MPTSAFVFTGPFSAEPAAMYLTSGLRHDFFDTGDLPSTSLSCPLYILPAAICQRKCRLSPVVPRLGGDQSLGLHLCQELFELLGAPGLADLIF